LAHTERSPLRHRKAQARNNNNNKNTTQLRARKGGNNPPVVFYIWFSSEEKEKLSNQNQNQMRVVVLCIFEKKGLLSLISWGKKSELKIAIFLSTSRVVFERKSFNAAATKRHSFTERE